MEALIRIVTTLTVGGKARSVLFYMTIMCVGLVLVTSSAPDCSMYVSYTLWKRHCYKFLIANGTFEQAQADCNVSGGSLVSVINAEEDGYIFQEMKNLNVTLFWLGLHRNSTGPSFSWLDGSVTRYTRWDPWEPHANTEYCATMHTSNHHWHSMACDSSHPQGYVCKAPALQINDVTPKAGPKAGGTNITLTGIFVSIIDEVFIGEYTCLKKNVINDDTLTCQTVELGNDTLTGKSLNVSVTITGHQVMPDGPRKVTDFVYQYMSNPELKWIQPNSTISSGGVSITVFGDNLVAVQTPTMVTTVTWLKTQDKAINKTACEIMDSSESMLCRTPPINTTSISEKVEIEENLREYVKVAIGFEMGGYKEYEDLKNTTLAKYDELALVRAPVIHTFATPDKIMTFTSTWPISKEIIEIKVRHL